MKKHRCILEGGAGSLFGEAIVAFCLETRAESWPPAFESTDETPFDVRAVERLDAACKGAKHEVDQ